MTRTLRYNAERKLEPADGNPQPPTAGDTVILEGREWLVTVVASEPSFVAPIHTVSMDDERSYDRVRAIFSRSPAAHGQ